MRAHRSDRTAQTHLVLIPSYNTGAKLFETVAEARRYWHRVLVVIDGSTDGTGETLAERNQHDKGLRILQRTHNGGKGAAVLDGLRAAADYGITHVLVMDADGQHPAPLIPEFIAMSREHPDSMILGVPIFGRDAPRVRVIGQRLSNALTKFETMGAIGDSLFGFRVYPVVPLVKVMESSRWMRRFDFDTEAAVRLSWRGVKTINRPAPVRYFRAEEGGVTHFRYGHDNFVLTAMHARLVGEFLIRLPLLAARRLRSSHH